MRAGASEVYVHGMPGGQYTNLREQARALGIADARWPEVAAAYADVNALFGDIVKVTPTSKVVGDLALLMVSSGLSREQVLDPDTEVAFPESVVQLFRGDLGQPHGGFPARAAEEGAQGGGAAHRAPRGARCRRWTSRPSARASSSSCRGRRPTRTSPPISCTRGCGSSTRASGRCTATRAILPTPVFFYGMEPGQEISVDLERGKTLIVRYLASSEPHEDGTRTVFFELNGQPRSVRVADRSQVARARRRRARPRSGNASARRRADAGHGRQRRGRGRARRSARGELLLTLEAMKMETAVRARRPAKSTEVLVRAGQAVEAQRPAGSSSAKAPRALERILQRDRCDRRAWPDPAARARRSACARPSGPWGR